VGCTCAPRFGLRGARSWRGFFHPGPASRRVRQSARRRAALLRIHELSGAARSRALVGGGSAAGGTRSPPPQAGGACAPAASLARTRSATRHRLDGTDGAIHRVRCVAPRIALSRALSTRIQFVTSQDTDSQ